MQDCQILVQDFGIGDWVEMCIDLDNKEATFTIWEPNACYWTPMWGQYKFRTDPISFASWFETKGNEETVDLRTGHLACVVKNAGGAVTLFS